MSNSRTCILSKQKIYDAYYPFPKKKLRSIINTILESNNGSKTDHFITPKVWLLLVEEIGEPTR